MTNTPKVQALPVAEIYFSDVETTDQGNRFKSLEFKGMVNGGYIVKCLLIDPSYSLFTRLVKEGYYKKSRSRVLQMRFRIKASPAGTYPETATKFQVVNIISLEAYGEKYDQAYIEFIGIDPPSWQLNTGDASGKVYKGKVSQVIQQVVQEYAPNIDIEIGETTDSEHNKYGMMRQDPKTFISSLIDWSSSITQNKTQWIISMTGGENFSDRPKIIIKEQAELPSKPRAFYRYWDGETSNTIKSWKYASNNALSIAQTKIVTQGLSAVSGRYLDRITDRSETKLFAKDSNTENKKIARTDENKSTSKPNDGVGFNNQSGWTSIQSIPEFNSNEIGMRYDEYIDGRARGLYLNLINSLIRLKLTVIGHGEWSEVIGLGTDTIYLKWFNQPSKNGSTIHFLSGNWLTYGFHHKVTRKEWLTTLYVARYDHDSVANKVGAG